MGREEKGEGRLSAVKLVGRASAANTRRHVRQVDKLKNIRDPSASITWPRDLLNGINKSQLGDGVVGTIVQRINDKLITNSKEQRRLPPILKDPVAKDCFLQPTTPINDALEKLEATKPARKNGLAGDLGAIVDSPRKRPWRALAELPGDENTLKRIEEAAKLLKDLRKTLKT